ERGTAGPEFSQDLEAQQARRRGRWRSPRCWWCGLGPWLGLGLHQLDAVEPERARNALTHRLQDLGPDHLKFLQLTDPLELVAHLRQLLLSLGNLALHVPQKLLLRTQSRA